jgi:3-oxoacyl-[acyl-carrier protein] reductase
MLDEFLAAGPGRIGPEFHARLQQQQRDGGTPLERGAELALFLASSLSDGISGRLLSAVWDCWETLPALVGQLAESDVYTLRRIVPADRAADWKRRE